MAAAATRNANEKHSRMHANLQTSESLVDHPTPARYASHSEFETPDCDADHVFGDL